MATAADWEPLERLMRERGNVNDCAEFMYMGRGGKSNAQARIL